jgi:Mrp family chromosome partitioning ATPase
MLEHLLERYDYIIIDTPSLDETNDTLAMSDLIAGIILVLNSGKTTYKEVYSSIDKISRSSSYLLGTIIHK